MEPITVRGFSKVVSLSTFAWLRRTEDVLKNTKLLYLCK